MKAALLPDRGVVKVVGDDAGKFLNGLLTVDIATVSPQQARFSALLTPQGKIIADFIVIAADLLAVGGYYFDCPRALAPALVQRLNFYKLRAKVSAEDLSDVLGVMAIWDGDPAVTAGLTYPDPRLADLGLRCILPLHEASGAADTLGATPVAAEDYQQHRIDLSVPQGGSDFAYEDAFPHEADMDQLGGIDFAKGCYVGQEVVSRVEHRGTARTRIVAVTFDGAAPEAGLPVTAGDASVGTMGSAMAGRGLASLRLDRVSEAMGKGVTIMAGGVALSPARPAWAQFAFPVAAAATP